VIRRLLLVGLLLVPLACGDDEDDPVASGATEVAVTFDEPLRPGPVTWTITLTSGEDLELSFADAQRADVALTRDGDEVYRWGRSQMFAQELGEEPVAAGEELTFELDDVLEVDPGEYELEASITATDRDDLVTTRRVTVEPR
jgi:hypothetical protein